VRYTVASRNLSAAYGSAFFTTFRYAGQPVNSGLAKIMQSGRQFHFQVHFRSNLPPIIEVAIGRQKRTKKSGRKFDKPTFSLIHVPLDRPRHLIYSPRSRPVSMPNGRDRGSGCHSPAG
jgi:hypothetical protein